MTKKETWEKLKNSATIRRHTLAEVMINSSTGIPDRVFYHRQYYQNFTLKRDLEKLKSQHQKIQNVIDDLDEVRKSEETLTRKSKRKCATSSSILPKECIFCKKRKTKNRVEENLILCIDDRARQLIQQCAREKKNFHITSIADLISSEARYHKSCYLSYTKNKTDIFDDNVELEAFKAVVKFCLELETFRKDEIIPFKSLVAIMEKKLAEDDLSMKASTRKNFKRTLETKIPSLRFTKSNKELYVYSKKHFTRKCCFKLHSYYGEC